ncbi:hypothetical protein vseg_001193 [Gypsophila vaccaria]
MLEYTIGLVIAYATPSTHFIFCLCNIIIVFLLVDRSKRNLNPNSVYNYPFPTALNTNVTQYSYERYAKVVEESSLQSTVVEVVASETATTNEDEHECEHDNKENEDDKKEDEEVEEEENDDDELRRRVEEFIDKINREWRAERLRTSNTQYVV